MPFVNPKCTVFICITVTCLKAIVKCKYYMSVIISFYVLFFFYKHSDRTALMPFPIYTRWSKHDFEDFNP